jgi:hypothetical protein
MEKAYWLGRKRASLKLAKNAIGPEARLIHYDLAGRYGVRAMSAETQAMDLADSIPLSVHEKGRSSISGRTDNA